MLAAANTNASLSTPPPAHRQLMIRVGAVVAAGALAIGMWHVPGAHIPATVLAALIALIGAVLGSPQRK
ncbi:hypothetical protein Asera_64130 [Actinocatenispora sera]|uniref:Uncharacterized protein n=1 Tax=Actinocatenispora sera TaxID=390989 RepID=A0A810LBP5_9ACTN|nr:hypothetical protein Asera_64130 [Actinocatenispora sera]